MRNLSIAVAFATVTSVATSVRPAHAQLCGMTEAHMSTIDRNISLSQGGLNPLNPGSTDISIWNAAYFPIDCNVLPCPVAGPLGRWEAYIRGNGLWHLDIADWVDHQAGHNGVGIDTGPYEKMLISAYVVWFGLNDDPDRSWHGTQDYARLAMAAENEYHDSYFRRVSTNVSGGTRGRYDWNIFEDAIELTCMMYDNNTGGLYNNPVARLSTILHEAWHAWENVHAHTGGLGHQTNPPGGKCVTNKPTDAACDYFYPHTLDTYRPFGTLHQAGIQSAIRWLPAEYTAAAIDPNKFHSPPQVEFEFLCDLADPVTANSAWVTMEIRNAAVMRAGLLASNRFINGVPVQCGGNHPMITF
jgi:hypothetical protein